MISGCSHDNTLVGYWESSTGNSIHFTKDNRVFINEKYCMQYSVSGDSLFFYRSDLECMYFELIKHKEEDQLKLIINDNNQYLTQILDRDYHLIDKNKIIEDTLCETINVSTKKETRGGIESGIYAIEGSKNHYFFEIKDSNLLKYEGNNTIYNLVSMEGGAFKIVIFCDEEVNQNTTEENFLFTMDYLQRLIDTQKQFLIQQEDGLYYMDIVVGDTFKVFKTVLLDTVK
ncbi:MAG: hypothetical protein KDE33_24875 [Bacteroidetes bacterium]|nr:hypothetical protein [Bacteroidota bacterium]